MSRIQVSSQIQSFMMLPLLAQISGQEPLSGLHDIAGPVPIPAWWATPAGIAVISVGSTALLAVLYFLLAGAMARSKIVIPPTPSEKAIAALGQARLQLGNVEPDEFVALVSDILRTYVSEQFGFHAREQTSQEFLEAISGSSRFNQGERRQLAAFLEYCDLIKFADEAVGETECNRLLDEAVQFVNHSAPIAEPAAPAR